jgi:opacity protein-like surface antigen/outer membrane receptor protein involved in Fe transport
MPRFDRQRDNIFAPIGATSTTWNRVAIDALPAGSNTPFEKVLLQFPGVSQDSAAEGNFHLRNEHLESSLAFRVNGILLPDTLGAFGQFLDPSFIGSLSLITGALPAQYGMRTVGVVDIKTAAFDNSGQISFYGGSRQTQNYNVQYGGKTGSTEFFFTGRFLENILGIQNPTPLLNAVHDRTQQDRSFAYVSTIIDPTTRLSFIGGTSTSRFQIPNIPGQMPSFTAFGLSYFPSALVDETQVEKYKFGVLALQKSTTDVDLQLAYFTRTNSVQFRPDLVGDLMFNGLATSVYRGSVANGLQADSAIRLNESHTVRAGMFATMEKTSVSTVNELLPLDGSMSPPTQILPDVPFPAIDGNVLLGWLAGVYLSDEWRLTDRLTLNTGARFDQMWQYIDANQLSPRIGLTYSPSDSTTLHAGFARNFAPPAQVIAAQPNTALFTSCPAFIGNPNCTTVQAPSVPPPYYLMQPERSNVYDIGFEQKVLPGLELGVDVYLKMTRYQINQGQFGAALVLNGFQYERGENSGVELKAIYTNGDLRAYANLAWANQRGNNVITNQYLLGADEFAYTRTNWVYADHSQVWTGSGGVSYLWYGTRFSADLIYGSGLRSGFANTDHIPPYAQVNAGISHEFDIPGWAPVTLRFNVVNVFDTSYVIKNGTGIGVFANAYGPRRGYFFGVAQKFGPGAKVDKPPAPAYVAIHPVDAVWSWTGFYMGANVGRSTGKFNSDLLYSDNSGNPLFATSSSLKHYGGAGGGQIGYNWQAGMAVAGLESDLVFGHQRTTTAPTCPGAICNPAITMAGFDAPLTLAHQHNLDWWGTVRARLGLAFTPDTFLYGTGGLAYGEVEHLGTIYGSALGVDANGNPITVAAGNNFTSRSLRAGWTAGAGLEARLGGNWTGRVEYLHVDLGQESSLAIVPLNSTPITIAFNGRITQDMVRLGINFKFDPYLAYVPVSPTPQSPVLERVRPVYKGPIQAVWTWTGFYFGANAGFATGGFDNSTLFNDPSVGTPLFGDTSSARVKGGIGGVQTGYNWQAGLLVAGLETDVQFSTQRNITSSLCPGAICNPGIGFDAPVTLDHTHNLDWFGTVRGRLGVAVSPDLVAYGTGGLAVGGIAHSANIGGVVAGVDANGNPTATSAVTNFTSRSAKTGYAVGAGIEAHLAGNVTGKIEYLHMGFGTGTTAGLNGQNTPPIAVTFASHVTDDIVRLGLNYKFDPNGADAPVYRPVASSGPVKGPLFSKAPVPWLWSWNGYYLGINAGYGWGRSNTDAFFNDNAIGTNFGTNSSVGMRGRVFGVQTGYNFQSGNWLWGVEADLALTGQVGNPVFTCPAFTCNPAGPVVATFDQNQKLEWFGTLRQRFGALITPDLLIYGTGGAAVVGLLTSGNVFGFDPLGNPATNPFSNISIHPGWAAGAGIEAHLTGNWTAKLEYLYMEFGSATTNINNQQNMTLTAQFNSRITDQIVRAGLNYKFDPIEGVSETVAISKDFVITKSAIVAPWTWVGFYAGFNIGYGSGSSETDTLLSDPTTGNPLFSTDASVSKPRGAIFGAQAGYNFVWGPWLTGIELDFQASNQGGTQTTVCPGAVCNPAITDFNAPVSATLSQRLGWSSTLRGRLGAVVDPDTLGYVTGGLALGHIRTFGTLSGSSLTLTPAFDDMGNPILDANGNQIVLSSTSPAATTIDEWTYKVGWSAGAGVERHLGGNLTGRVEYLHLDFGNVSGSAISLLANSQPVTLTYNHRVTNDILRLGLNYKFDPIVSAKLAY